MKTLEQLESEYAALGEFVWWLAGNDYATRSVGRAVWFCFELILVGMFVPMINIVIDSMEGK